MFFSQLLPSQKYSQILPLYQIHGACGKPHGFPTKNLNSRSHSVCNLRLKWKWIFFPLSLLVIDDLTTWWSGVTGLLVYSFFPSTVCSQPLFFICDEAESKSRNELEDHQRPWSGNLIRLIVCFDFSVSFGETFLHPHRSFQTTLPKVLSFIPHPLWLKSPPTKDYLFNTGSWGEGTNIPLAYPWAKRYYLWILHHPPRHLFFILHTYFFLFWYSCQKTQFSSISHKNITRICITLPKRVIHFTFYYFSILVPMGGVDT